MKITDIKRFAIHDGDGIRTTVFFKGCPLRCRWCHNPESIRYPTELGYYENKCRGCWVCAEVCPGGAHVFRDGTHVFDRSKCTACGKCAEACPAEALHLYGREATADELLSELLEDAAFYRNSGGGVTLSGGECLAQADGCAELLQKLRESGIDTAVDTCGFAPREAVDKVLPYTNTFLYDIKQISETEHIRCTGQSNRIILDNAAYISGRGVPIEVRIPFVPGYNDGAMEEIGEFLTGLKTLRRVRLLPYHNLAGSKYAALGMENTLPDVKPENLALENAASILRRFVPDVIIG